MRQVDVSGPPGPQGVMIGREGRTQEVKSLNHRCSCRPGGAKLHQTLKGSPYMEGCTGKGSSGLQATDERRRVA